MPESLTVTIYVKFLESLKQAELDINENTLVFKYADVYYLDINLMYRVDKAAGSAKFDKSKKTLTVKVPVAGSTEDSQKVLDQHYADYLESVKAQKEKISSLKKSKLDDLLEKRRKQKAGTTEPSTQADEDSGEDDETKENQNSQLIN